MKSYREQTYYELLEVDPSATMDDIRNAYSRQVRLYDSDSVALYPVGDPAEVEALKKLLLEAMEILTDDDLRVEYDKQLGLPNVIRAAPTDQKPELPAVPPDAAEEEAEEADEIDHRADESREEADQAHTHEMQEEAAPALHPTVTEEPPPDEPEEEERAPAAAAPEPEPAEPPPSADEIDDRAEESREEADKEEEQHAHDGVELAPPTQLAMDELLARAEAVHSTGPRYSFSWVQQGTTDIVEVDDASIIPLSDVPSEVAAPARADEQSTSRTASAIEPSGPVPLAPLLPPPAPVVEAAPPPLPPKPAPVRDLSRAQHIAQEEAIATAESALAEVSHLVRVTRAEQKAPPPHAAPAPSHAPPPRPRVEIGPDTEIGGELLRQVRESRGLTLHQLADRTRITTRHLENVEADRYDALPPTVYLRGILMSIARELGLDALRTSKSYLSLVEKALGKR